MDCNYLNGENLSLKTAKQARMYIGKEVEYLCKCDIDRSGRGYFFPKKGIIVDVSGRDIAIDTKHNFVIHLSDLVEMVVIEKTDKL